MQMKQQGSRLWVLLLVYGTVLHYDSKLPIPIKHGTRHSETPIAFALSPTQTARRSQCKGFPTCTVAHESGTHKKQGKSQKQHPVFHTTVPKFVLFLEVSQPVPADHVLRRAADAPSHTNVQEVHFEGRVCGAIPYGDFGCRGPLHAQERVRTV